MGFKDDASESKLSESQTSAIGDLIIPLYLQALASQPEDVDAHFGLGLAYMQFRKDLNRSLECFLNVVSHGSDDPLYSV